MKNFFTPVSFSTEEAQVQTKNEPNPAALKKEINNFHLKVMELINDIEKGYSNLRPPTQITGSPLFVVIDRMHKAPNKESLNNFFEIALQDLGNRFKTECENYFNNGKFPLLNKIYKG